MKNTNSIITAVISKAISERDEILVRLDMLINKNNLNTDNENIVSSTLDTFKKLNEIERTIETINVVLDNNSANQTKQQIEDLSKALSEINPTKNDNNNS